jgi:sulfate transport system permease protein
MAQVRVHRVLPGFGLSMGYTLAYMSLIVLIPLAAVFIKTTQLSFDSFWEIVQLRLAGQPLPQTEALRSNFWAIVTDPRVMASYRLSFGASLLAAAVNVVFGFLLAWSLVRYEFRGKRIVDALVDLPFALPTAVAGISLAALYAKNGWLGYYLENFGRHIASGLTAIHPGMTWLTPYLEPIGLKVAYAPLGVLVALVFIGLPFVVRTVQPVLEDLDTEIEEAAASLGAGRWQTMWRVVLPTLVPALLTGFALALARAVGEYGSVIFIAGNIPMVSEIAPLIIITKLEQYDYAGATAVAAVMLVVSFLLLLLINGLQSWSVRRSAKGD